MIKTYYRLTKPGIVYGNAMTAAAGFLLATINYHVRVNVGLMAATLVGIALVIASACVCNNYTDRGIDHKMARTKNRALATGQIKGRDALIYAFVLGMLGFLVLAIYVNLLTVLLGITALLVYVVFYGIGKRLTVHGTVIGSIAGALPITAGYTAVSHQLDMGAAILFMILTLWQMPHFYAIALYRLKDYTAAALPVLPITYGARRAKLYILWYIVGFGLVASLLTVYSFAGYVYLASMSILCVAWLRLGFLGFNSQDNAKWGRKMFLFSLVVIVVLCIMVPLGAVLP